jgi:tetratricopeptide (TPR) repeat protein
MNAFKINSIILAVGLSVMASKVNANSASDYCQKGSAAIEQHRYGEAIVQFQRAIDTDPKCVAAFVGSGNCYRQIGNAEAALRSYDQALKLNPMDDTVFEERGLLYLQLADNEKAVHELDRAIQLNPKNWVAVAYRAKAYANQGLTEKVSTDLHRLTELQPESFLWYGEYADSLVNLGRNYEEAVTLYSKSLHLCKQGNQAKAGLLYRRGTAYGKAGHYGPAINDFSESIALNPDCWSAYHRLADMYFSLGQKSKGIAILTKLIERCPKDDGARRARADAYFEGKSLKQAIDDYKVAAELRPERMDTHQKLARAYELAGRHDLAQKELAKAKAMQDILR